MICRALEGGVSRRDTGDGGMWSRSVDREEVETKREWREACGRYSGDQGVTCKNAGEETILGRSHTCSVCELCETSAADDDDDDNATNCVCTRTLERQAARQAPAAAEVSRVAVAVAAMREHACTGAYPRLVVEQRNPDPSDVEGADLLAVPAIVNPSASSDSVAHSVRSAPAPSRWIGLLRTLSRKKHSDPARHWYVQRFIPEFCSLFAGCGRRWLGRLALDTLGSSPVSPALLPPHAAALAANGRRISSPASSIYRAGLSHVQRRAPPSRANLALQEFTKPLVLAAGAPIPPPRTRPIRAPVHPRSVSHADVPSHSLRIQLLRARILHRLEEGALTPAEEADCPLPSVPPPRSLRKTRASPNEEWVAISSLAPEQSLVPRSPSPPPISPSRTLIHFVRFIDPSLFITISLLPFLNISPASRRPSASPPITPPPRSTDPMANSPLGASSAGTHPHSRARIKISFSSRTPNPLQTEARSFVESALQTTTTPDGDDLPLAVLASVQKKRAEREARARHARYVEESADPKNAHSPKSTLVLALFKAMRAQAWNARPVLSESGHRRSGSSGTSSSSQRRRSTVGESMIEQVVSPTRSVFAGSTSSSSAPNTALPSPASPFAVLPRSLPSSARASPAPLPSPNLPFAGRSMTGSPLRSSFALGMNQDEFGAMLAAAQNQPSTRALIAQNQALMAQNQMLASMMMGKSMNMDLGLPNPPFAHSGGSSASGSRGRSPARSSGGASQGSSRRPGPSPVQAGTSNRTSGVPSGAVATATATQRGRQDARGSSKSKQEASRSRPRPDDTRPGHSKSASQSTTRTRPGHAHSKSEHSIASQRTSRLGMGGMAPPMPNVPTGVYSMHGRPRPSGQVVT
ncbi:hypothetical protein RhiXN_04510 [Rhizoctonia solani]|uniref:Uncharacterized protein n=1 Tax=Rhizoctonia solani TaxID=456999 RepID=A0A8H8SSE7_9AGAM|nr:uncharacterized protein RhiXN_04510 [Rhizoctonia solani]QRW16509.1 hypothetical protein RhiXN_04510 [Rhizoctonia solani]